MAAARPIVLALLALALRPAPASAQVDEPLAGRSIAMRQRAKATRLVLVARSGVIAPLPGTGDDPTLHGAGVHVGNPRTGEWARLEAPAAGWSRNAGGTVFRFRPPSRVAGPGLRSVVMRHGKLLRVKASVPGITLDEPAQGAVAAVVTTGTRRYCLVFGGDIRRDRPAKFAARDAPAPAACPEPPEQTTSTTTTTTPTVRLPGTSSTTRAPRPSTSSSTARAQPSTSRKPTTSTSTSTSSTSSSTRAPAEDPVDDPMNGMGGNGMGGNGMGRNDDDREEAEEKEEEEEEEEEEEGDEDEEEDADEEDDD